MHLGDTFNENSNRIQGSNHPEALSSKAAQVRNLQFCFGQRRVGRARLSECYSGGAESKARDESRCAAPDLVRRLSAENCRFLGREN